MQAAERGISPEILFTHVENTVPFFTKKQEEMPFYSEKLLSLFAFSKERKLSQVEYFELCLLAHYTTVASFVPTDVDNQIRKNLWNGPAENLVQMAELVLHSYEWDFRPVTERYATRTKTQNLKAHEQYVSGHQGEWFSVAVGAYAALRGKSELAEKILTTIEKELHLEASLFHSLWESKNGVECLRAATLIAHNLGDLDRVIDQWDLPESDPLRRKAYKLGHGSNQASLATELRALEKAGALNKAYMASENHRHYPLRAAKALRKSKYYFLPLGPFLYEWGEKLGNSSKHCQAPLESEELAQIAQALLEGFQKLSAPKVPLYGYARALAGLLATFPGGAKRLADYLPAKAGKNLLSGPHQIHMQSSEKAFQENWGKKALQFLSSYNTP